MLVQLDGEPLNRTTGKLIQVISEPVKIHLLDLAFMVATPGQLVYAAGVEEGADNASDGRCRDVEVVSYRCHGPALVGDQFNDPFPGSVVNFIVLPSSDRWHGAAKSA